MSEKALALIFINLGGEMLYVLDQRLYAQKIQTEKGKKIMQDIVSNMFSERFLEEIFRPQEICSRKALRTIFERLAHTSIMRLNESSMDKLFDLMTMAVKYQISLISHPREILSVTLNHLDSIVPFVTDSGYFQDYLSNLYNLTDKSVFFIKKSVCVQLIEQCYKKLLKHFANMHDYELQFVRHTMLNFFQDLKIKVSVFLKEKVQNWNGSFILYNEGPVACGSEIPGTITYFDEKSYLKETKFNPGSRYSRAEQLGSIDRNGDRITKLGLNVYSSNKPVDTIMPSERGIVKNANTTSDYEANIPDPRARAQLDILCKLIGKSSSSSSSKPDFKLNLFNNEEEEFIYSTNVASSAAGYDDNERLISFDASKRHRDERLDKVMNLFTTKGKNEDDDPKSSSKQKYGRQEDDDDDDIVAMMDKLNK